MRPEVTAKKNNSAEDNPYLPAARVWARYGVSAMSLHRWLRDPTMRFPKPMYIGRYRYWKLSDLVQWERQRAKEVA